jgi:GT2 family glycosyltransferase
MNKKTLAIILHYNSTQYTDTLYEMLKPYENNDYDLLVFDNGSDQGKESKYTTHKIEENCYYGGGLDIALQFFLEDTQYDSFVLLNSDLIIHGYNFIKNLRTQLFAIPELMLCSACIIQPGETQCYWPQMHCWNSQTIRYVPWVDNQCVLVKREFVEEVKSFGSKYGWVQDVMSGIICEDKNWKIGVCDWIPILHYGCGSINDNLDKPDIANYNNKAYEEMIQYFEDRNLSFKLHELREKTKEYTYYN